ncbi:MAG: hypothetical protein DI535_24530 [Citrobacter freundii]|nr:MAG: hypothetical protein DI535_24530 [Citrobacter freundii]
MNIDRNNYEEFFILYLDNELSASDRQRVEEFANANTDLKAELELLLQSKLQPETDITFEGKAALLKNEEEIAGETAAMLLYVDDEMNLTQKKAFEEWVAQHPDAKKELGLFQQTRLQPEHIVFPYKQSLYRKEEHRVVAIRWWRMAAAAVLLLGVSTTAYMFNQKRVENQLANNGEPKKENVLAQNSKATQANNTSSTTAQLDAIEQPADHTGSANTKEVNATEASDAAKNNITASTFHDGSGQQEKQLNNIPGTTPQTNGGAVDNSINGSGAEHTQVVITKREDLSKSLESSFAINNDNLGADPSLTINKQINPLPTVTQEEDQPLDIMNEPGKKNRLRGFFRKITRTFEKTTNIKATDGEDRLLVGGLAIKF